MRTVQKKLQSYHLVVGAQGSCWTNGKGGALNKHYIGGGLAMFQTVPNEKIFGAKIIYLIRCKEKKTKEIVKVVNTQCHTQVSLVVHFEIVANATVLGRGML